MDTTYYINVESNQGQTILTKVCANNNINLLKLLLQYPIHIDYETKLNHTTLTWYIIK